MANRALGWAAGAALLIVANGYPRATRADTGQGQTPLADDRTLVALAVALACADAPEAGPAAPAAGTAAAPSNEGPELELVATVHAKALRFDVVPKTQVLFHGTGRRKTVWKTERVNLPMHPEPGVPYRDVHVRLTVTSDIEELAALLQEAKRASAGILLEQDAPAAPSPARPAAAAAPGAPPAPTAAATPPARTAPPAPVGTASPPAAPSAPAAPAAPPAPPTPAASAAQPAPAPAR
jgi:hypothetical protein